MLLYIWSFFILLFLILYVGAAKGYTINLYYAACAFVDAMKDIACQVWLDIRKLWGKKVDLDEHERHIS